MNSPLHARLHNTGSGGIELEKGGGHKPTAHCPSLPSLKPSHLPATPPSLHVASFSIVLLSAWMKGDCHVFPTPLRKKRLERLMDGMDLFYIFANNLGNGVNRKVGQIFVCNYFVAACTPGRQYPDLYKCPPELYICQILSILFGFAKLIHALF